MYLQTRKSFLKAHITQLSPGPSFPFVARDSAFTLLYHHPPHIPAPLPTHRHPSLKPSQAEAPYVSLDCDRQVKASQTMSKYWNIVELMVIDDTKI
jgi:hypothetical protein